MRGREKGSKRKRETVGREGRENEIEEGKRRVRGSCFRPGEQQCPQTNEHPASIVRLIGTRRSLSPVPLALVLDLPTSSSRGPRRSPTPGWGVLDQPDAGQHRLNIAASSNLRQRDSSLLRLPPPSPSPLPLPVPGTSCFFCATSRSLSYPLPCFCLCVRYVHPLVFRRSYIYIYHRRVHYMFQVRSHRKGEQE